MAGPASGYAGQPSPSSAVSVCLPWCTRAANLQEVQTSWVPPIIMEMALKIYHPIGQPFHM